MEYRKEKNQFDQVIIVRSNDDGTESWIPSDPTNSDYQRYLNSKDGE
jgi:hypothetical protein